MSTLENTLKQLRLSGLLQTLDVRLQEATANRLGHAEFLELICQDEINVRQQRLMERRTKAADFRGLKTLEDFDWSFNPAIHWSTTIISFHWRQLLFASSSGLSSSSCHLFSSVILGGEAPAVERSL